MTATISVRRLIIAMVLLLLVAIFVGSSPRKAWAIVPGLSATVNNPTPNPVPAGETATTTIVFSLAADSGPINVGVELQAPAGFGALRLDAAGTSPELVNCVETPTQVTCDWDGESVESPQTLAVFIDVDPATAPGSGANLAAIASSVTEPVEVYSTGVHQRLASIGLHIDVRDGDHRGRGAGGASMRLPAVGPVRSSSPRSPTPQERGCLRTCPTTTRSSSG